MTALIILLAVSVGCWFIVLNPHARENLSKPVREFYRARKDYQDMFEASSFAAALVGAIFFTIFFLFLLVMRIAN
jgi:cbb3-type cytochrome oxidase subunit 3